MKITTVRATEVAETHIWEKHGVLLAEAAQALRNAGQFSRGRGGRHVCIGTTENGRRLRVVCEIETRGRAVTAWVVTAFDV